MVLALSHFVGVTTYIGTPSSRLTTRSSKCLALQQILEKLCDHFIMLNTIFGCICRNANICDRYKKSKLDLNKIMIYFPSSNVTVFTKLSMVIYFIFFYVYRTDIDFSFFRCELFDTNLQRALEQAERSSNPSLA